MRLRRPRLSVPGQHGHPLQSRREVEPVEDLHSGHLTLLRDDRVAWWEERGGCQQNSVEYGGALQAAKPD